jgi:hypothetical protein
MTLLAFENTVRHDFTEQRFTCTPKVAQRLAAYFEDSNSRGGPMHFDAMKEAWLEACKQADEENEI